MNNILVEIGALIVTLAAVLLCYLLDVAVFALVWVYVAEPAFNAPHLDIFQMVMCIMGLSLINSGNRNQSMANAISDKGAK